jgi:hypothetical protein
MLFKSVKGCKIFARNIRIPPSVKHLKLSMNVFFIILVYLLMNIYKSDIVWESITSTYYK